MTEAEALAALRAFGGVGGHEAGARQRPDLTRLARDTGMFRCLRRARCTGLQWNSGGDDMTSPREDTLFAAALSGDIGLLQRLLPVAGDVTSFGAAADVTLLMAAASRGHESVVELLLQRGCNPSRRDANVRSAAAHARAAGHTHLAERLDHVVDLDKTLR